MEVAEILPLSRAAIRELLRARTVEEPCTADERRRVPRWPFPGTVEIWSKNADGLEFHQLGTCSNLSEGGAGIVTDCWLPVGDTLDIAIHQPEASYHGRAIVRHCSRYAEGYGVGMEFIE
ncbi:MAG TPA: PilZ domain-containing protein [Phycisphaerae bacterium]|jgi:hypothetical protein